MEREQRRIATQVEGRALSAQAQRVFDEALGVERARQRRQQAEDMKLLDKHPNIAHFTVEGVPVEQGIAPSFPLGPEYEQRAQEAGLAGPEQVAQEARVMDITESPTNRGASPSAGG
jgi:hypothetical protein